MCVKFVINKNLIIVLCFWYSYLNNFIFIFILKLLVWEFLPGFCYILRYMSMYTEHRVRLEYPVTLITMLMLSPTFAPLSSQAETCVRIYRLYKSCQAWSISNLF